MYFVQHITFIYAFRKILPAVAFLTGALDKISDLKVKLVVIKFFIR